MLPKKCLSNPCVAPARRGKVHYFRNTALRYSSAVRLPLLFPKKSFGFFGDPIFPLHKGTKALHRKNGGSDSRPPSFRPTAVFILHLSPGYFWLNLTGWDYNPSGLPENPSSVFSATSCRKSTFPSGKADCLGKIQKIILHCELCILHSNESLPPLRGPPCSAADGRPLCPLRGPLP